VVNADYTKHAYDISRLYVREIDYGYEGETQSPEKEIGTQHDANHSFSQVTSTENTLEE